MDKIEESNQEKTHSLHTSRLAGQIDQSILPTIHFLPASETERESMQQSGEENEYCEFFKHIMECHSTSSEKLSIALRQNFLKQPFHEQLKNFELCQQLTEDQSRIRWQTAVDLLSAIRTMPGHGNCDALVFGSLLTGLSNPASAIDISVDIDGDNGQALRRKTKEERKNIILEFISGLEVLLKNARRPYDPDQKLFSAVSLSGNYDKYIQLEEAQTGVKVVLSFDNQRHLWISKLLKFYINFEPRTKQLIMFLKYWTKFHNFSVAYNSGKWPLTVLILVFLMQKNMIPSVLLLQAIAAFQRSERGDTNNQDGHDSDICYDREVVYQYFTPAVYFRKRNTEEEDAQVFLDLLTDFYEVVVKTIFIRSLVSPHLGQIVRKKDLKEKVSKCVNALPAELANCWNKLNPTYFKSKDFVCRKNAIFIQDPFEPYLNTARQLQTNIRERFVEAAKNTLSTLRNNPTTLIELFVRPYKIPTNEFVAILEQSKGDTYIKRLVDMLSKPDSDEARIHRENTANEILQAFQASGDSLRIPGGLFKDPDQFDAIRVKLSTKFLEKYMLQLHGWGLLRGSNEISTWQLTWQVTALWRGFTLDFLANIFTAALKLMPVQIFIAEIDDFCSISLADIWTFDDIYTQKIVKKCKKNAVKILSHTKHIQKARNKFKVLRAPRNAILFGKYELQVTFPFWRRTCAPHYSQKCPLEKEAEISFDSYNNHMEEANKYAEAASFIPFKIFVLYKLDARADVASQVCGESSIMFAVQEAREDDVPLKVQQERKLARKCVVDTIQRTFDVFQLRKLTHWMNRGMKIPNTHSSGRVLKH